MSDIQIHSLSSLLGEAIKQRRCELDITQQELARRIKKKTTTIEQLEQAEIPIDSQTLEDCAHALGLSPFELVKIAVDERRVKVQK